MSGALIDLAAVGIQDTYLTGDPKTTYFRQVYKQHTNFATETIRQVIEGDKVSGSWSEVNVSRNGDLLTDLFFLVQGGDTMVTPFEEVQLLIGGKRVDTITAAENCACAQAFRVNSSSNALAPFNAATPSGSISLQFFFGRSFGNALPLIALQYHDVTLRIKWGTLPPTPAKFDLYGDYIHLDNEERNSFIANPINMLIEQHQRVPLTPIGGITVAAGTKTYTPLEFSHPVKAVYGAFGGDYVNAPSTTFTIIPADCVMRITFNGKELTPFLPASNYYSQHQVGKHTEHSASNTVAMYSFALFANRQTPTGSCNFSRIDNARLEITKGAGHAAEEGSFYALNWNVLNIENGMGGLLFAN